MVTSVTAEHATKPPPQEPPAPGRWDLTFRTKLVLGACALVVLTGTAVTWLAYRSAARSTTVLTDSLFREVSARAVAHTQSFVLRAAPIVETLKRLTDNGLAVGDPERLARQLLAVLAANPGLSWVSYGEEDGTFTGAYRPIEGGLRVNLTHIEGGHTRLVEYDVRPDGSWVKGHTDDDSGYDPRTRPFYQKAKQEKRLVWLPPYVFYNQGVPGTSCAAPVYDKAGRLRGVVSVDFDLNALSEFVAGLSVSEHSRVFLFTTDGILLARPDHRKVGGSGRRGAGQLLTLADAGDPLLDAFRANLPPEHVHPGDTETFRHFEFRHDGTDYLASANTFRVGDDLVWVVGAVAPKSDFLSGVWRSQAWALAAAAAALVAAVVLAALMARRVSGPVLSLIGFMRRVGAGDLDARAELGGGHEFRQLSDALNHMIVDLRDRLRLRHSLDVAMDVQQRLLPRRPPTVPGLDVAGHSTYCDETGGDYYDFLVVDRAAPDTLLIALGDVMGHGVAAALVMAGVRAVLRDRASAAGSLAQLMEHLNRLLAADLEGSRFMTMHLSVLSARTGTFRWASAGHDPAIIFDPATDHFDEIDAADLPLGIMEDGTYAEHCYDKLRPGQVITISTDGVWETMNGSGEQYGKDRLRAVIRGGASQPAAAIAQSIVASLNAFRGSDRPTDDVTFVIIKVLPVPPAGASG
jgi:serine phosphatase RsbU (regulator of sigma subunit)